MRKGEYKMWEMDYDAAASHLEKKDGFGSRQHLDA